ncbi:MAG: exopolyphosphatase [gamma proteobacterium symbiont of Ctena orbiculata]|uniref:Exopolyphosphatase n=1 Tax=Candidatus Thiodiazotropha taylori TaxID=2792791 RepID=A0A944QS99_9GAMM|nr:exopolyphosphatase [Candidatus Thiodiazotropha taylori]PUB87447.1 MAG: exopolyphosphatase [gamma proteobacterium symbiont of Ctena orbiculata]MBT2988623.1 exopolyphosphatase [Candidatus Thiodiazotropha taylori]MBT2996808.1 exopolyphosphatase [Candidatus Thiodiazotropha taylori]MBT3002041.1 exopolyphosphatase [Candidatus Thiodiazotropha taylori]
MSEQIPEVNLDEAIAAIDLGSNSFHLIVARVIEGHLQIIDRMKETVRLGEGLTRDKRLEPHVAERALECLRRYAQRLRPLPAENVRVVGTNTMRQIHPDDNFHGQAEKALLHPIEIIAGREEARLIYLGVAHGLAAGDEKRLVVDIGGGSTELIIGQGYQPEERESLHMGCVSISRRFFADGKITPQAMRDAELACSLEIRPVRYEFRDGDWARAIGSSGSIKSIGNAILQQGWSETGICCESLERLKRTLIDAGSIDKIALKGVSEERKPVFAGGLAVLSAIFEQIGIEHMEVSSEALREGLIYDMVGRSQHEDARDRTLTTLMRRYDVDQEQVERVEATALALLEQAKRSWKLQEPRHVAMLSWATKVHEIGLTVSHSQFQKHGAYLLEKSDLSGFSLQEQKVLAAMVRGHRRKFPSDVFEALPREVVNCTKQLSILLRLSILTHRARSSVAKPIPRLEVEENRISLVFPEEWIAHHPLTRKELEQEADYLEAAGYLLRFS